MTWSARLGSAAALVTIAVAVAATVASAQSSPGAAAAPVVTVPSGLTARVTAAVATMWATSPDRVRLEWGLLPAGVSLDDSTAFRLIGTGDRGWFAIAMEPRGHAPIAARLHAGVAESLQVAARPLPFGATLVESDITTALQVRWSAPTPIAQTPVGAGWITRRPLAAGDRLDVSVVTPPPVVLANQPVHVEWVRGGVQVEMSGVALGAAALGQPVTVRMTERTQTATGVAIGSGRVRIGT